MGMAASQWGSASSAVTGLFSLRTKELTNHVFNCISTSNSYVVLGPLDPLALKHPTVIFYYYRIHKMCFSYSVKNWSFSVLFLLVNNRGGSPFFIALYTVVPSSLLDFFHIVQVVNYADIFFLYAPASRSNSITPSKAVNYDETKGVYRCGDEEKIPLQQQ